MLMFSSLSFAESEQQVLHDYHLTTYKDMQGSVQELELFTKLEDRDAFFGVTCTGMSPFPLLQVVLFNDEVLSDAPRLIQVDYKIDGKTATHPAAIQGILKAIDTVEERSNKIRIEVDAQKFRSMAEMKRAYQGLLDDLMSGERVSLQFTHRSIEGKTYRFSLKGLKPLLQPYEAICY